MSSRTRRKPRIAESLREYGRGVAGGLLFSLPLLYTMEVWRGGLAVRPGRLLACMVVTFVLLLGYNRYAGIRRDSSEAEVLIDSVEEMGLGLLISAATLFLLGRVTADMGAAEIIGPVVLEAMIVAIGVSVGTAQLGAEGADDQGTGEAPDARAGTDTGATTDDVSFGGQLVIAFCGAILFAANVAPTEEIVMIAAEISSTRLLGVVLISVLLGGLILFHSNFAGADRFVRVEGRAAVLAATSLTYAVGLAASALILWFFGRFEGLAFRAALAESVVLALPATIGASAGRLLLQRR